MPGAIYLLHLLFWSPFFLRRKLGQKSGDPGKAVRAELPSWFPFSRWLVAFHAVGFAFLYVGVSWHIFGPPSTLPVFPGQRFIATVVILFGVALVTWSLLVFRSWRLQAAIEVGHELCREGPFRVIRNPIYLACDLLALGTIYWAPVWLTVVGALLIALAGDARARAEESVLAASFGEVYRDYRSRTKRFLPGIY